MKARELVMSDVLDPLGAVGTLVTPEPGVPEGARVQVVAVVVQADRSVLWSVATVDGREARWDADPETVMLPGEECPELGLIA